MMLAAQVVLAAKAADVSSGAVLTLVMPLALLLVALVVWYAAFRRGSGRAPSD